jgi:hypothetical protein
MSILHSSLLGYNIVLTNMQLTKNNSSYIEKIIRDAEGRLVRATFCVYENGGRVKARLVSAVVIQESKVLQNKTLFIGSLISKDNGFEDTLSVKKIVSPYFDYNFIYSLGSKPRAPTKLV